MPQGNLHDLIISNQELYELTGRSDFQQISDLENISKLTDKDKKENKKKKWYRYFSEPNNSDRAIILRPSFIQDKDKTIEHFIKRFQTDEADSAFMLFVLPPVIIIAIMILSAIMGGHFVHKPNDFVYLLAGLGFEGFSVWYFCETWFFKKRRIIKKLRKSKPTRLGTFLDEVDKYNSIVQELINQIEALDRLTAIGHPVTFNNREEVIASFEHMRSDLVRALQTERILREKDIRPEQFSIEFVPMRSLEFHGEVQQLAKIVNDAAEIGLAVQEEMRKLCVPENKELQEIGE